MDLPSIHFIEEEVIGVKANFKRTFHKIRDVHCKYFEPEPIFVSLL